MALLMFTHHCEKADFGGFEGGGRVCIGVDRERDIYIYVICMYIYI